MQEAEGPNGEGGAFMASTCLRATPYAAFQVRPCPAAQHHSAGLRRLQTLHRVQGASGGACAPQLQACQALSAGAPLGVLLHLGLLAWSMRTAVRACAGPAAALPPHQRLGAQPGGAQGWQGQHCAAAAAPARAVLVGAPPSVLLLWALLLLLLHVAGRQSSTATPGS